MWLARTFIDQATRVNGDAPSDELMVATCVMLTRAGLRRR